MEINIYTFKQKLEITQEKLEQQAERIDQLEKKCLTLETKLATLRISLDQKCDQRKCRNMKNKLTILKEQMFLNVRTLTDANQALSASIQNLDVAKCSTKRCEAMTGNFKQLALKDESLTENITKLQNEKCFQEQCNKFDVSAANFEENIKTIEVVVTNAFCKVVFD